MEEQVCKNCGYPLEGKFCSNCGEKVYSDHDKSMRHFFDEVFHFFTHLDSKFLKTIFLIFRRPGRLSLTFCNGVRRKYYNPVSLFFIGVILYLLFPKFQGLNMNFYSNLQNFKAQHMQFMIDMVNHKAVAKNISIEQLSEKYDHMSAGFAKIMLLIILPLTALVLKLLFWKKKKYFFDYLILATESSSIMIYLLFLIFPLLSLLIASIAHLFTPGPVFLGDVFMLPLYALFLVFWTTNAFRIFFGLTPLRAFGKGLLFLFFQSVVIFIIYRLILFLAILLFI